MWCSFDAQAAQLACTATMQNGIPPGKSVFGRFSSFDPYQSEPAR
jgi:hypothetical protein